MFDNTAQAQMVAHVKEDGKRSTTRSSVELNGNIRNNKHAFQKFTPKRVRLARACFPGETLVFDRKGDPSQRGETRTHRCIGIRRRSGLPALQLTLDHIAEITTRPAWPRPMLSVSTSLLPDHGQSF